MWIIFLALVVIFELAADVFSKEWSLNSRYCYLAGAIIFYLVSNLAWLLSLKYGSGLARGVTIFSVAGAIIAIAIGVLFYKEQATRLQAAGMVLGLASLALIFWNEMF